MKKKLLIIGILILIGVMVLLFRKTGDRDDDLRLVFSGNVEVTEVDAGFKYAGRIRELPVEEGQKVRKGERLAELDSAELESQVRQGKAYLDEARIKLEELKAGARPQEVEHAKASVRYADAALTKAERDYERAAVLFENGAIPAQAMDAARKTYDATASERRKTAEALSLVQEGPRKEIIAAALYRVRQAEAGLLTLEERLKDTVIYAPLSGVIMRKNSEAGETIAAGIPVCTLGDLETPWIKIYVKEDKLGLVKLGQKAEVSVDSYPGKTYDGTVTYIASEAEFTPKNIQTQEERVKLVFGVKIGVKNVNDELKPGMPADVTIKLR